MIIPREFLHDREEELCHVGEDMSSLHLLKMGDELHVISGSGRIAVRVVVMSDALDNVVCIMCCAL
jgi:hypothetical protein